MASRPPFPPRPNMPGAALKAYTPGAVSGRKITKYSPQLQNAAAREGISFAELNAFMAYWSENELKFAQKILDFKDAPENAIDILKLFVFFRNLGLSAQQMAPAFVLIASLRSPVALSVMHHVATNGPTIAAKLRPVGGALKALALFITAVEVYNLIVNNQYSEATAKLYKTVMGLAVPWGGAIDAIQSFFPEVSTRTNIVFKILRACDPVGLGGAGVDAFVWMVQSIADKVKGDDFDEDRLNKLADRLKTGPTAIFYEFGEKIPIGELLYDLKEMSVARWEELEKLSMPDLHDTLRRWRHR